MNRSAVQKRYYDSVTVYWLDRTLLWDNLVAAARRLGGDREDVLQVVLFGSVATGSATAASDVDLFIEINHSQLRWFERGDTFEPYFRHAGLPPELFVYTSGELESERCPPLASSALRDGIVLYRRADPAGRPREAGRSGEAGSGSRRR